MQQLTILIHYETYRPIKIRHSTPSQLSLDNKKQVNQISR